MAHQEKDPNLKRIIPIAIVVGAIILIAISWSSITVTIDSGHAGVKFQRFAGGLDIENPRAQGFHIIAPWDRMTVYEIRTKELEETMDVLSSNGLNINIEVSLWFSPNFSELGHLHDDLGVNYVTSIVRPGLRSATRTVIGRYTPDELYAESRDVIQNEIEQETRELLEDKYVSVNRTLIRSIRLPTRIQEAIEGKLEFEQEALQYEFRLQTAAKEAERQKIEAEGRARANRIISQSLTANILREKGIQATRDLAESQNAKIVVIGSGDDGLPIILGGNN